MSIKSCILAMDESQSHLANEFLAGRFKAIDSRNRYTQVANARIIPIQGMIVPSGSYFNATSIEELRRSTYEAIDDPNTNHIVYHFETPGGFVNGTQEFGSELLTLRDRINMTAYVSYTAASGGFWLASCMGRIIAEPSAEVGSIGVIAVHMDESKWIEEMGIKVTVFRSSNAPNKARLNSMEPLQEETITDVQKRLDEIEAIFHKSISKGMGVSRKKILSDFGQGKMLSAPDALSVGMIDSIGGLSEALSLKGFKPRGNKIRSVREFESFLRDVGGFSITDAKLITNHGFTSSGLRDEDNNPDPILFTSENEKDHQRLVELFKNEAY